MVPQSMSLAPYAKKAKQAISNGDEDAYEKVMEDLAKLEEKYPFADKVQRKLRRADDEDLGSSNVSRYENLEDKLDELSL